MLQADKRVYYTLRIAAAMCFIGHGAFGIITKQIWCNYFAVFGIGHDLAYTLMPVVGSIDILFGLSLLIYPTRAVLMWLVIWGSVTALLRPMSGEPFTETIERAGNFGAPLALLILYCLNGKNIKGWFNLIGPGTEVNTETRAKVINCLRIIVFLLLIGHGWLNLIEKKSLIAQYSALGFPKPSLVAEIVGIFEIIAAFNVLIRPVRSLLMIFLVWKMGTELFYPHWELFEFIERGGSYGSILALCLMLPKTKSWVLYSTRWAGIINVVIVLAISPFLYLDIQKKEALASTNIAKLSPFDQQTFKSIMELDRHIQNSTFVFVNNIPDGSNIRNHVIMLPPIGNELRIDFDQYVHKGHKGQLYIILPNNYAGPKEKFILKAFPDYKGWYGSMINDKYVMYVAK